MDASLSRRKTYNDKAINITNPTMVIIQVVTENSGRVADEIKRVRQKQVKNI